MTSFNKGRMSMLFIATLLIASLFAQTSLAFAGKKEVKCATRWTKIFDGSVNVTGTPSSPKLPSYMGDDDAWEFSTRKTLSYEKLEGLIASGCNFQVVQWVGLGGGAVTQSYTCQYVSLQNTGTFRCLSSKNSFNGTEESAAYTGTELKFGYAEPDGLGDYRFNGKLYLTPYADKGFTNMDLRIYTRG